MFRSARLKLTGWYLLILMTVSFVFSGFIYGIIDREYTRIEQAQISRQQRFRQRYNLNFSEEVALIPEAKERLQTILVLVNLGILSVAGFLSFILAGRTLQPIAEMMEDQNRFITDSSHELRTPLTAMKSEIEVSLRDTKLTINQAKKLLESNLEEVNNLQLLSDNLIRLTQYQKNNGTNFELVNLKDISVEAVKKVAVLAKEKNIIIKNSIKNINLNGDKQSLIEMFVIFLDNAIKYSGSNTKVILLVIHPKGVHSILISIKDQGFGISQEDQLHLFDRFYRGDKSRSRADIAGYGLGLSIAKQIVEKHHGKIMVESEPGKGSTFIIQLPEGEV